MGAWAPPLAGGLSPASQQICLAADILDDVNWISIASPGNPNFDDDSSSRSQHFKCTMKTDGGLVLHSN